MFVISKIMKKEINHYGHNEGTMDTMNLLCEHCVNHCELSGKKKINH